MAFGKSKKGASLGEEPAQHVTDSSNSNGANAAKDSGRGKIMGVFSACKVVTFSLLLWLVQCSSMYSGEFMNGNHNMGRSATIRPSRLLGQPLVEFDQVFDLYQRSFLDKMGCDSNQKDQIRTMMKSYFDKIDLGALAKQFQQNPCSMLQCPPGMPGMPGMPGIPGMPGMFPPMKPGACSPAFPGMCPPGACPPAFPGLCGPSNSCPLQSPNESKSGDPEKKKEGEEGTSNDGDGQVTGEQQKTQTIVPADNSNRSPVLQYLNYFNFLWSTSFIIMSSIISACFGQFHITLFLFSILFLKALNFFWTLKMMHDMFFPKKK